MRVRFLVENLKQRNYPEDLGINGIILKGIQKVRWKRVEWMHLPQNKKEWRVIVDMVMNHRFPENVSNFLTS